MRHTIPQILVNALCLLASPQPIHAQTDDTAEAANGRVAFYAHMVFRETPFADMRGIYPIAPEQANRYKHYRFVYDGDGRPVEVSFRFGDELVDLNISRTALTFAPLTRIEYRDGQEIRRFFDIHGNRTLGNGVFREMYALDVNGNRKALEFYSADGERIESGWGVYRYEWTVDRRGTVTETRVDSAGVAVAIRPHFPFYCLKLHYDQRGLLALMENYGKTCDSLTQNTLNAAQDRLEYNAKGGFRAWNVYDADEQRSVGNGPMVARGVLQLDGLGHTTREHYEDTAGRIMTNAYGWTNTCAEFDEFGNMTSRFNHDAGGAKADNPELGYSGYVIDYDESGKHRVSLRYFDAGLQPATHAARGYHAVRTDYGDAGNRIRTRYEDAAGKPVEHGELCAAIVEYGYDELNRVASMRLFDTAGQPAAHCDDGWHETRYHYHPAGPLSHTEQLDLDRESVSR
jgi:YD repeat-containing protein